MTDRKPRPPTPAELAVIDAMRANMTRGSAATATFISKHTGQTPQGAAEVLASAVRKGLTTRHPGRPVTFSLTRRGWDLARQRSTR